jgi:hypothetical protein
VVEACATERFEVAVIVTEDITSSNDNAEIVYTEVVRSQGVQAEVIDTEKFEATHIA